MLELAGTPRELIAKHPDPLGARLACVCWPTSAAVVIGSAQSASDFDAERVHAARLDLVRRRSGGGAVLVAPGCQVWLDVFIPAGDVLSHPDVNKSFYWLGDVFAGAITRVLAEHASDALVEVNRSSARSGDWRRTLCYTGLGAGEVTVAGRKVVGMSQRRERSGAWIYSMTLLSVRGVELAEMLGDTPQRRDQARTVLEGTGLVASEDLAGPVTQQVLASLP